MKILVILALLSLSFCLLRDQFTINKKYIEELKNVAEFQVYSYEEHPFKDLTSYELQMKLGLKGIPNIILEKLPFGEKNTDDPLPDNFNYTGKWPECSHPIRDQQRCGSCWAFAASEVVSDRFCIATYDSAERINVILSPQDMVSCDTSDLGCNWGYLDRSWDYLQNTGIVTDECYPYTSGAGVTGTCTVKSECTNNQIQFKKYKTQKFRTYSTFEEINRDIFTNVPVETGFQVYQDFMSYQSGIYKQTSNVFMGGHAVKVVGWGTENGTDYWVVANSWGTTWGEQGHFRIAMNNCCNFEASMIYALPNLRWILLPINNFKLNLKNN